GRALLTGAGPRPTAAGGVEPGAGPTTGPRNARRAGTRPPGPGPAPVGASTSPPRPRWRPAPRAMARWGSKGHVPVLALGQLLPLAAQHVEAAHGEGAGVGRVDDVIDVAPLGRGPGVDVALRVLLDQLGPPGHGVGGLGQLPAVEDLDRAAGAHDRELGRGPGVGQVGADRLGVHDHVGAAVGLAGDELDPGHGGLAEGVEQLGAVADDPPVLLVGTGQEPGHVHEGDEGDVEGVARAHETAPLLGGVDVEHAGQDLGLVADDAHDVAVEAAEPAYQASGPVGRVLEELAVVE